MPALDGVRILDMTQYEAGTSCTQALAWLGADVVKIERPGTGDPGRGVHRGQDHSAYFVNWNSNKRSLTLDLQDPRGREILLRLAPRYDVFVENYGPGVMEKLDLGYEVMKAANPAIIYARIKGFGLSGPYSDYKCFDPVAQAAGGSVAVTGEPDGPPLRPGITVGDSGTGVQMALAILAAYIQRLRTGEGQTIEIAMQEAMTYWLRTAISSGADWGRKAAPRTGSGATATSSLYPCAPGGPNDYVVILMVTPRMWDAFCDVVERPALRDDPRFETAAGRREHSAALHEEIAAWTSERDKREAMRILGDAGGALRGRARYAGPVRRPTPERPRLREDSPARGPGGGAAAGLAAAHVSQRGAAGGLAPAGPAHARGADGGPGRQRRGARRSGGGGRHRLRADRFEPPGAPGSHAGGELAHGTITPKWHKGPSVPPGHRGGTCNRAQQEWTGTVGS